jgi:hypothetical protein
VASVEKELIIRKKTEELENQKCSESLCQHTERKMAEISRRGRDATGDSGSSDYEKREESAMDVDEEKAMGLNGNRYSASNAENSPSVARVKSKRSTDGRSLKTTRSHQSRGGGDGYTYLDAEPNNPQPTKTQAGAVAEEPYLVTWDGDADPLNPRSMSNLRRWVIVLICSASSLCV